MNNKLIQIPLLVVGGVAVGVLCSFFIMSIKADTIRTVDVNTDISVEKHASSQPYMPEEIDFCGERMPIENIDVYEAIDYELVVNMYRHSQTIMYIKRANRYFPEIEKILKENNIPDDFKYLCVAESGLSNVVSTAGAAGFWQFMKTTGKEYGMRIDNDVDERYDRIISAKAACKYFKTAYSKYKNWTLVAASYNMGMGGLSKNLTDQDVTSYYDVLLNAETARYVYRIVALKIIMQNPELYGFHFNDEDLYTMPETYTVTVDTTIADLTKFAKEHNTNIKVMKYYNPWLRGSALPNQSRKEYRIELPK
ncbi:MAG: lytic transglycosylase domain-containing protein [Bacteroidales bacterium]|nr:lytic transglycosylase domain-containing protein [Bacteroidales bacterium]